MSRNPIAPGNHDKAWNDPPQLSFNSGSNSSSSRLKMMKKRIPVPMNATSANVPPAPSSQKLNPPPMQIPAKEICLEQKVEEMNLSKNVEPLNVETLTEHLEHFINKIFDGSQEGKVFGKEDVMKRIDVLKEMWTNDQLHSEVQRRLSQLIDALNMDDYDTAWSLHQSLIVDYTADCSTWMSGIKTLISEGRNLYNPSKTNSDPDKEELSQQLPLFMNPEQDK